VTTQYDSFRREYIAGGLSREMLDASPIHQYEVWLEQAVKAGLKDPTAMVLATVDEAGLPWQRIVLLKGLSHGGFVFYTNYGSAKAAAIAHNPSVSLLFPWNELDRQVIVGGTVEKMSVVESASYFLTRPRESQIAAWASRQSRPISARSLLEKQARVLREKFGKGEIPMPDFWGGYRVLPQQIEFWQGGEHRLHDRFRYHLQADASWRIEQLQP
tara:strand:- start:107275 stop:107919 length:645 start_codon:yes stop_codon:yes gene_type:complete